MLRPGTYLRGSLDWDDEPNRNARERREAPSDRGLKCGMTESIMASHRAAGFLSVSRTDLGGKLLSDDEPGLHLRYLAELSVMILMPERSCAGGLAMKLSKREHEVLRWIGEGKTSAEMAIILSTLENTVNFHSKNMQKKFNAPNKTQIDHQAAATE